PARAFLPPDLFQPDGRWICLRSKPTATVHVGAFSGHSRFLVFMNLPGGRAATLKYLHELYALPKPFDSFRPVSPKLSQSVPQFPVGTQVALVRQLIVFDSEGKLAATPITESVQLRVFHSITPGSRENYINGPASHDQDFFEFDLHRRALL